MNTFSNIREKRSPYRYKNNSIYDGEWIGNKKDGYGVMTWEDGARYEGLFFKYYLLIEIV